MRIYQEYNLRYNDHVVCRSKKVLLCSYPRGAMLGAYLEMSWGVVRGPRTKSSNRVRPYTAFLTFFIMTHRHFIEILLERKLYKNIKRYIMFA